ncbi:hypothetical protein SprV_0501838100 [Sparganum proliferum]
MRALRGELQIDDKPFKVMFVEHLPAYVQNILASGSEDLSVSRLAEMADKMFEVQRFQPPSVAMPSTSSLSTPSEQMAAVDFAGTLFGKAVSSKIDLVRAFHRIPVTPEDIPKTAVTTLFGLYESIRMLFGLLNADQTFQRFIDHVLRGLPFVYAYIDDLLVANRNEEEHKEHLALVSDRLDKFGIVTNPSKFVLGVPSPEFLGHYVVSECLRLLPSKVEAIHDFPLPTSKRQLQRFLGMVNFYRRFLPNCVGLMLALTNMLSGPKDPLDLIGEALTAFERIKNSLADTNFLRHPAPEAQLSIMVGASTVAVDAVLQQNLAESTRPLAFSSKKALAGYFEIKI